MESYEWNIRFFSHFGKMPKIPAEGEYFAAYYNVDHAFRQKSSDAMHNLIGHFNNIILNAGRYFFGPPPLDSNDTSFEIFKKFNPRIESVVVFAKVFEKDLPQFSSFY